MMTLTNPRLDVSQPPDYLTKPVIFCLPKNGRLKELSLSFIEEKTGINAEKDKVEGVEFLFLREKDIAKLLKQNQVDMGIIGLNSFKETFNKPAFNNALFSKLDFGVCRLSIAVANESDIYSVQDLEGKRILTSYPNQLKEFLFQKNIYEFSNGFVDDNSNTNPRIEVYEGGLEQIARLTKADAIADIVETGKSLYAANMRELEVISNITAGICYQANLWNALPEKSALFMQALSVPETY